MMFLKIFGEIVMTLNSFYFIFFFLIVVMLYFIIPIKMRKSWLLLTSYIFCLTYNSDSLIALIYSTIVSYLFGIILNRLHACRRKAGEIICLWGGIFFCILPWMMERVSQYSLFVLVGTSFYVLQEIAYLIDIYRGKSSAEKNPINYALFIAFFPKLVSGPIERSDNLLRQMNNEHNVIFDYNRVKEGFLLIIWGYFEKSVIADSLSFCVNSIYGDWESYSGAALVLATVVFAFQLYADFAGYTNIAIGAAQVLGFGLQDNFRQPYLACSIKDFWRRWHISLSIWLRDYIYIPLGGNRKGIMRQYVNLMITFLISGLWHGAGWNFLAWGLLHGAFHVIEKCWQNVKKKLEVVADLPNRSIMLDIVRRISVFVLVDIAWIFFRASGLKSAIGILNKCFFEISIDNFARDIFFSLNLSVGEIFVGILLIMLLFATDILRERNIRISAFLARKPAVLRWFCYIMILLILTIVEMRRCGIAASNFIYMQF